MQFPALARCILVESRFSSRRSIERDLRATQLFENIVEADSLDHGASSIRDSDADACIVGPSVTLERADQFIESLSDRTRSEDCAFLRLVAPERADEECGKSHVVAAYPRSKAQFADSVVEAVVKANASGAWAALRAKYQMESGAQLSRPTATPTLSPMGINPSFPVETGVSEKNPAARPSRVAEVVAQSNRALDRLTSGVYFFRPDGLPTSTTKKVVQDAVLQISSLASELQSDRAREVLENLLYDLVRATKSGGPKIALPPFYAGLKRLLAE